MLLVVEVKEIRKEKKNKHHYNLSEKGHKIVTVIL